MTRHLQLSPFADLAAIQREVDRVFGGLGWNGVAAAASAGPVHYGQDEDNLYVELMAPGYEASELDVRVEDGVLRIAGKREEKAEEGAQWRRRERRAGEFAHRVRMPVDVEAEGISASYRNGVLTVTLPKAATAKPKQIEINVS